MYNNTWRMRNTMSLFFFLTNASTKGRRSCSGLPLRILLLFSKEKEGPKIGGDTLLVRGEEVPKFLNSLK